MAGKVQAERQRIRGGKLPRGKNILEKRSIQRDVTEAGTAHGTVKKLGRLTMKGGGNIWKAFNLEVHGRHEEQFANGCTLTEVEEVIMELEECLHEVEQDDVLKHTIRRLPVHKKKVWITRFKLYKEGGIRAAGCARC